jgi:hypothetical protein
MIFTTRLASRFSSAVAQKTFAKFTERYTATLQEFQKKVASSAAEGEQLKKSTLRAYVHPYSETHHRAFSGIAETLNTDSALRGPEQVSPHYEHFSFARRQALLFVGGLAALRFIASTEDFFMFAQSATWAWTFYFAYSYFWLEGKKFFLLPFLSRFYKKLLNLEISNVETYWAENTEVRIRNFMATAKGQIEYKAVHTDYLGVRNNALLNVANPLFSTSSPTKSPLKTTCTPAPSSSSRKPRPSRPSTKTRSSAT